MNTRGNLLIADDEETFRCSTADLLIREGYHVEQAPDGAATAALLERRQFDLLIADIKMPGNPNLELVKATADLRQTLPVILVTGYPDIATAIESIRLPVVAYLVKPVDFDELCQNVDIAVRQSQASQRLATLRRRLDRWNQDLEDVPRTTPVRASPTQDATESFISLTVRHIVDSLTDLQHLASVNERSDASNHVCHLMECPRLTMVKNALAETIQTLERTKHAFKSRELAELRRYLEQITASVQA